MAARRRTSTRRASAPRAAKPAPLPPVVGPGERLFVLSVPYEERGVASASGATYNAYLRQTIYIGQQLPYGLTPYASPDFSWERYLEDDENGQILPVTLSSSTMTPRPHQKQAADKILATAQRGYRGFLEADDVGVGKTISSLVGALLVARLRGETNLLIMCPKGVIAHWRRTLASVLGQFGDFGLRIVVINYDQSKKLLEIPETAASAKRARTKNKQIATKGTSSVEWGVILFDESQKLKNAGSQRRAAAARIARYADTAANAPFVIWMSATAGQNPVELGYLVPLLAQLTGAKKSELADYGQWLADQGFCVTFNSRFKVWQWGLVPEDAFPAEVAAIEARKKQDLARIRTILFDGADAPSIRRLPTDIAGWPEIQRILHPVELDAQERALYEAAWSEFRSSMQMVQRGRDPKGGMAVRMRFRQKSSLIRTAGTVEQALDLLDNGHQVVISVQWMESLDAIREGLEKAKVSVAEFSGRNESVRERERKRFQYGQAQVILFTVTEGISLHQREDMGDGTFASDIPRTTIVHDPRYSGIETIQIEGRAHRDGQKANVYYAFGADTVDEQIVRTLVGRISSTKEMAGDDISAVAELEAILDGGGVSGPPVNRSTPPPTVAPRAVPAAPAAARPATAPVRPAAARPAAQAPVTPQRPAAAPAQPATARRQAPAARPASQAPVAPQRPVQRPAAQAPVQRPAAAPQRPVARPAASPSAPVRRTRAAGPRMTPEEQAFRDAMAGGKARPVAKRAPSAAEQAALREALRRKQ